VCVRVCVSVCVCVAHRHQSRHNKEGNDNDTAERDRAAVSRVQFSLRAITGTHQYVSSRKSRGFFLQAQELCQLKRPDA